MSTHIKVIGWLHVIFGIFGLCMAALVFAGSMVGGAFSGSFSGMVGAGLFGSFAAVFITLYSLPTLLAGYGLLTRRPWARILTIILAVFELIRFPFGTALGIYSLWVLLSEAGAAEFKRVGAVDI